MTARTRLLYARKDFEAAWESLGPRRRRPTPAVDAYRIARDKWVETVLRDVAGWAESLSWGQVPGVQAQSPNRVGHRHRAGSPDRTRRRSVRSGVGGRPGRLAAPDTQRSVGRDTQSTGWKRCCARTTFRSASSPTAAGGRWCAHAPSAMTASGVVDALTWVEEPRTRDAFLALIARQHIIGGDPDERLPVLFEESVAAAEEITEALGAQVRRAVELLIQSFSESAARRHAARPTRPAAGRHPPNLRSRSDDHDAHRVPAVRRGTRPAAVR